MEYKLPLKIFSVDPATGVSGWSLLSVENLNPLKIRVLNRGVLNGQKLLRKNKEMLLTYQKQFCILDALALEYKNLLKEYNPDVVVSEGAFGYVHLSALISLTLAIHTLRRTSRDILDKDISEVAPMLSKKAFTGTGTADKSKMREAYFSVPFLIRESNSQDDISEHEIDAIAHGCAWVKIYVTKEIEILSKKKK